MTQIHYGFGNPIAETTVPAAVADGAGVNVWFDEYGRQVHRSTNVAIGATDISDVTGRIPDHQRERFDVAGYDRSRPHHGIAAEPYPREDCRVGSNRTSVFDAGRHKPPPLILVS